MAKAFYYLTNRRYRKVPRRRVAHGAGCGCTRVFLYPRICRVVWSLHCWGLTRALRQGSRAMQEAEITEQFRLFQQAIVLAGEAVETLQREQRAAIDTLRLEVEVLKRCVFQLHPELATQFETMRADLIRAFDPEAS